MTGAGTFDPEATMAGFQARRPLASQPWVVPPPSRGPVTTPAQRPQSTPVREAQPPPPFGNFRGNRIAYTVNLPSDLAGRLNCELNNRTVHTSYGAIAVEAIRTHWTQLRDEINPRPDDALFPLRRVSQGRLTCKQPHVRKVLYITTDEAVAIEAVRRQLGGIELGQLHRLALNLYLT